MNCAFTEELKDEIYQKNYTEHEILQNAYNGKVCRSAYILILIIKLS